MKLGIWGTTVICLGLCLGRTAHAQETSSSALSAVPERHASGLMLEARLQTDSGFLGLGGGPGFVLGYQGPAFSLGLGAQFSRVALSAGGDSVSGSYFELAPTFALDVWHSRDRRASASLIGSVGYARGSLSASSSAESCTGDSFGNGSCSTSTGNGTVSAALIPVRLGFGGDYFLSRNFALGAELGVQALFLAGTSGSGSSSSSSASIDAGADAEFAYGALRATFVLGD